MARVAAVVEDSERQGQPDVYGYEAKRSCGHTTGHYTTPTEWNAGGQYARLRATPCLCCAPVLAAKAAREQQIVRTAADRGEKLISARRASTCSVCQRGIEFGVRIAWLPGARDARHAGCGLDAAPVAPVSTARHCTVCRTTTGPFAGSSVRGTVCLDCYDRVEA